jgi:hypothetical protein
VHFPLLLLLLLLLLSHSYSVALFGGIYMEGLIGLIALSPLSALLGLKGSMVLQATLVTSVTLYDIRWSVRAS